MRMLGSLAYLTIHQLVSIDSQLPALVTILLEGHHES